jgi:transposase
MGAQLEFLLPPTITHRPPKHAVSARRDSRTSRDGQGSSLGCAVWKTAGMAFLRCSQRRHCPPIRESPADLGRRNGFIRFTIGSRAWDQVQSVPPPLQGGGEGGGWICDWGRSTSCASPPPSPSKGEGNACLHFTQDPYHVPFTLPRSPLRTRWSIKPLRRPFGRTCLCFASSMTTRPPRVDDERVSTLRPSDASRTGAAQRLARRRAGVGGAGAARPIAEVGEYPAWVQGRGGAWPATASHRPDCGPSLIARRPRASPPIGGTGPLHFLQPYCPNHNKIERLWLDLHAEVTRNHPCPDIDCLMRQLRRFLQRRSPDALDRDLPQAA